MANYINIIHHIYNNSYHYHLYILCKMTRAQIKTLIFITHYTRWDLTKWLTGVVCYYPWIHRILCQVIDASISLTVSNRKPIKCTVNTATNTVKHFGITIATYTVSVQMPNYIPWRWGPFRAINTKLKGQLPTAKTIRNTEIDT